ncbi:MAG TPA: M23 family metallopeptidase [Thermoanaerobaculia bacterium]|nr:M23 family metallopeptidase [Thermoanaerobaculia bacterium]
MRTAVSFLIGCVLGATAILMWVEESGARAVSPADVVPVAAGSRSLHLPVEGIRIEALRSDFHEPRSGGRRHEAIDILAPRGTPVLAVADGTIRKLFTSKAGGLTVYHYDDAETTCYYYAHLDRYAENVREGMTVARGAVIGYVGTTGNAPKNAPHLHFAILRLTATKEWWKGEPVDPYPLLTGR